MTFLKVTAQLYMCYGPYYSDETDVNAIEAETAAQARHVFETFYPTEAARGKVRGGKASEDFVQTLTIAVDLEGEDYDCKAYECAEWIPAAWFDEAFGFDVNGESMTFRFVEEVPEGMPVFYLDDDRPGAVAVNPGYDADGYDRYGYDADGYDRDGYNFYGYDRWGYNDRGFDRHGYDADGYDVEGFDREGYDRESLDRDGYDEDGFDREGYDRESLDRDGYDRDGYDEDGYDGGGYDRDGKDEDGGLRGAYTWD